MRIYLMIFCALIFAACNQQSKEISSAPKGELAFLLQYNNRLPSDVGFLTNHIMERLMANLMKENYEPFIEGLGREYELKVDTNKQLVYAYYGGKVIHQQICVDVANDAIWIEYIREDTVLHYADRTSIPKPVLPN